MVYETLDSRDIQKRIRSLYYSKKPEYFNLIYSHPFLPFQLFTLFFMQNGLTEWELVWDPNGQTTLQFSKKKKKVEEHGTYAFRYIGTKTYYKGKIDLPLHLTEKVQFSKTFYGDTTGFYYDGVVNYDTLLELNFKITVDFLEMNDMVDLENKQSYIKHHRSIIYENLMKRDSVIFKQFNTFVIILKDWKKMVFTIRQYFLDYIVNITKLYNGCIYNFQKLEYLYISMINSINNEQLKNIDKNYFPSDIIDKFSDDKFILISGPFDIKMLNNLIDPSIIINNNINVSSLLKNSNIDKSKIDNFNVTIEQMNIDFDITIDLLFKKYPKLLSFEIQTDCKNLCVDDHNIPMLWENAALIEFIKINSNSLYITLPSLNYLNEFYKFLWIPKDRDLDPYYDNRYYVDFPIFLKPSGLYNDNIKIFTSLVFKYGLKIKSMYLDHQNITIEDIGSTLYTIDSKLDEFGYPKRPWKDEWFSYLSSGCSLHVIFRINVQNYMDDIVLMPSKVLTFKEQKYFIYPDSNYKHINYGHNKDFEGKRLVQEMLCWKRIYSLMKDFKDEFRIETDIIWTRNPIHTAVNYEEMKTHILFLQKRKYTINQIKPNEDILNELLLESNVPFIYSVHP